MTPPDALLILQRLAEGIDPQTGEIFPADSPYQRPQTVRALDVAISALQNTSPQIDNTPTVLTSQQQEFFEKLRRWRNRQAEAEGIPPFTIAHNRMLTDMVLPSIHDEQGLFAIKGFGAKRMQKYGAEILELLNGTEAAADTPADFFVPTASSVTHTLEDAQARYPFSRFYPLLLTEITQMHNDHFCLAGFDIHTGKMVRPLLPNIAHWTFGTTPKPFLPGQLVNAVPIAAPHKPSIYPHRNEDRILRDTLIVLETWTPAELYAALCDTAKNSILQIFVQRPRENRYYIEGTQCPSLGCLKIARRRVLFQHRNNRLRLNFEDNDGTAYSLPVTCNQLRSLYDHEHIPEGIQKANARLQSVPRDEDILIRIGLTRGYAGANGEFDPRRCFIQVNGILTAQPCFTD